MSGILTEKGILGGRGILSQSGVLTAPEQPPSLASGGTISGSVVAGDPFTAHDPVWLHRPTATAREWYLNGEATGITGLTFADTYYGDEVLCRFTATNAAGTTEHDSDPISIARPHISGNREPGESFISTDAGQWYLNGAAIAGETADSIEIPTTVNPGDVFRQARSNEVTVGSYDYDTGTSDATTMIAAVITAGGANEFGTSAGQRATNKWALAQLILSLKGAGLYTGRYFRIFSGRNTIAGALASGQGGTVTGVNFVNGDLTLDGGLKGNGSTKRLATSWAGNATTQNSFSVWVWVSQAASADAAARYYFGN